MIGPDDTVSRSALDCLAYLDGENLAEDEAAFWHYIASKATRYPVPFIPPFAKPKGKIHVRRIVGAYIGTRNDARGQPVPRLLQLYDGSSMESLAVTEHADGCHVFIQHVLTKALRSAFIVFPRGGRVELRLIAQRWATTLIEQGFTVDVLMGGGKLKALIIRKGRHVWYLVCWEALTGLSSTAISSLSSRMSRRITQRQNPSLIAYFAARYVQSLLIQWFGTGLSLTISNTGLRAAAQSLPENVAKFRPLPILVAMCREGAGFRGGLVKGSHYRGPTWLVDLNRAYTAALRYDLPWKSVLDKCERSGVEQHGIWMCRIRGRRGLPSIYVGKWNGSTVETDWHTDQDSTAFLAVIPSAEIGGLRALGYDVVPGFGMAYVRTFNLEPYVERIVAFCQAYGWRSAEAKISKQLGNSVYGKLASPPVRRDLRISKDRPSKDWYVFIDEHGLPVEDLWERQKTVYQWSQHVDVAADITARVRGWMYDAQAETARAGGKIVAMSTDALCLTIEPDNVLAIHESEPGRWKLADADVDGIVAGPNAYAIGAKVIAPDYPHPLREAVVELFHTSRTVADAIRSGAPVPGAPLSWRVRRTITLGFAEESSTKDERGPPLLAST